MSEAKYVIAGDFGQFIRWCRDNNAKPRVDAYYVSHPDQLRGIALKGSQVVYVGTYDENRDWPGIRLSVELALSRVTSEGTAK